MRTEIREHRPKTISGVVDEVARMIHLASVRRTTMSACTSEPQGAQAAVQR